MPESETINTKTRDKGLLSVIIPAHNEAATIELTVNALSNVLNGELIPYEIIFIDDGSIDDTWNIISKQVTNNDRVMGLHFSRNFGKEAAIHAGLASINGDCCAVMDCDLQHPPTTLLSMYRLWQKGYDIVEGVKLSRGNESFAHKLCAGTFYKLMSKALGFNVSTSSDFKLLDRKVANTIARMRERNTFFRALSFWTGFKSIEVPYEVQERVAGKSSWTLKSLAKYAVSDLAGFTTAPMQLVTIFGVVMFILAILQGIEALSNFFAGRAADGFTTVIMLLLFIGSIIMISLGLIGFYIARIYEEVKDRPRYLIDDKCGNNS